MRILKESQSHCKCRWWLASVFGLLPALAWGAAQPVVITVTNKHFDPSRPVPGVRVTLIYFDGSQRVTDARDRTNHQGKTELQVSEDALERGDLRVEVEDAAGLVMYQPSEGLLKAVPRTLEIALLPKGSPALLSPPQIEAMLDRLSRLSIRNQQLRAALTKAENKQSDFDLALRDWAIANGFAYAEADRKVHEWAEEVVAHREQESIERQAEAELGLRHYQQAAMLFEALTNSTKSALDKEQAAYLVKRRTELRDYLHRCSQAVKAFQFAHQFHRATQLAGDGSKEAAAEHEHYPKDVALQSIWIRFALKTERARTSEAETTVSQDREALLNMAADRLQELATQVDRSSDRETWSDVQFTLGGTLSSLSDRVADKKVRDELKRKAVERYRAAIESSSRQEDPKGWAIMQAILGDFLSSDAIDQMSPESSAIPASVDEAIAAFQNALKVLTRSEDPEGWVSAQKGLSVMKFERRQRTEVGHRKEIGAELVAAQREVLDVLDREHYPQGWAAAHESLANALMYQGLYSSRLESIGLLSEAIGALRAALEVFTREAEPRSWLLATNVLCEVLELYARRVSADESAKSFAEAMGLRRAELEVLTKEADPLKWAHFKRSLGELLFEAARRKDNVQRMDQLQEAAFHFRDAAEALRASGDLLSSSRADTTLGKVLSVLATRNASDEKERLFSEAAKAWEAAIDADRKNIEATRDLSSVYHDVLFDFPKAYAAAKRSAELQPTPANQLNSAEASFTTSRFNECLGILNSMQEAELRKDLQPVWQTLVLACQAGAHQSASAQTALILSRYVGGIEKSGFSVDGDLKFLSAAPEFSSARDSWSKVFQALAHADGAALAESARDLSRLLGH